MKMTLFATALALSSVAFAQETTQPETPPAGSTLVAPGNSAPQPDAYGTPVVSDPAAAPAGFNQPPQVGGTGVPADARPAPQPATQDYRPCSRTVTDNCVQTYDRRPNRR